MYLCSNFKKQMYLCSIFNKHKCICVPFLTYTNVFVFLLAFLTNTNVFVCHFYQTQMYLCSIFNKRPNVFVFHIFMSCCRRGFSVYSRLGFQPAPPPPLAGGRSGGEESEWSVSFLAPHLDSEESSSSDSEEEDDSSALLGLPHPLSGQARRRYTSVKCCPGPHGSA
jgi:hypothetical protein